MKSRKISEYHKRKRIQKQCPVCGGEFEIFPSYIKKGRGIFCSLECYRKSPALHPWFRRGSISSMKGKKHRPESILKMSISQMKSEYRGDKHHFWRGGNKKEYAPCVTMHGHKTAQADGQIYMHRLIIEKVLGRCLKRGEIVHHINGVRVDNRISNLMALKSLSAHAKLHTMGFIDQDEIVLDGRRYEASRMEG